MRLKIQKLFLKTTLVILTIAALLPFPELCRAVDDDAIDVSQQVDAGCGNLVCETGEDYVSCPTDCTAPVCGNAICETGENSTNCPADCGAPPGMPEAPAGSSFVPPSTIYDLIIVEITRTSAKIDWKTIGPALCKFHWGQTPDYEKEIISEGAYDKAHTVSLDNLSPETFYYFKIFCQDLLGSKAESKEQKFRTLLRPDFTPPANVSNFEAIAEDGRILLKWQNPQDSDFAGVRILRSEKFYPKDPWDGELIYEGKENNFSDSDVIKGNKYYYTAFSYDRSGNYSSGAVAFAIPGKPGAVPELPPELPPELVPPEILKLNIKDFGFWQGGKKIDLKEEKGLLLKSEPLTIGINYEKVPEVLKTIMVTLEKPGQKGEDSKYFSFLLRINKEKTAYEATIASPEGGGKFPFLISVLDYKNQTFKKISGQLDFPITTLAVSPPPFYKKFQNLIIILIFSIILASVAYILLRRNRKKLQVAIAYEKA